jgi:ATP-dependent helicase HrpA
MPACLDDYPDSIVIAGVEAPISYTFEPGAAIDGATASIPLALFRSVPHYYWEWLLPVFWRPRIVEIARQMAKACSSPELVPRVEEVVSLLMPGKGPFLEQALPIIGRVFGLSETDDFRSLKPIPPHLWLRCTIVDENGIIIETIQPPIRLSSLPVVHLGKRPPLWQAWCRQWEHDDISDWGAHRAFQPVSIDSPGQPAPVYGITGLARENGRVCMRVFFNRGAAYGAHRQGVRLLLERSLSEKIAWAWRDFLQAKLIPSQLRERMDVLKVNDSLELIFSEIIFHCDNELPHDSESFDRLKEKAMARIAIAGPKAIAVMTAILPEYEACLRFMQKWKMSRSNPSGQTERLKTMEVLFQDYTDVLFNPSGKGEKLDRLPRYFRGFLHRLHMAADKPKHYEECVRMLWEFQETAVAVRNRYEADIPDIACKLDEYEEMIEEYALMLFAHGQVPTRFPVSEQRLQRCKETLVKALDEKRGEIF